MQLQQTKPQCSWRFQITTKRRIGCLKRTLGRHSNQKSLRTRSSSSSRNSTYNRSLPVRRSPQAYWAKVNSNLASSVSTNCCKLFSRTFRTFPTSHSSKSTGISNMTPDVMSGTGWTCSLNTSKSPSRRSNLYSHFNKLCVMRTFAATRIFRGTAVWNLCWFSTMFAKWAVLPWTKHYLLKKFRNTFLKSKMN